MGRFALDRVTGTPGEGEYSFDASTGTLRVGAITSPVGDSPVQLEVSIARLSFYADDQTQQLYFGDEPVQPGDPVQVKTGRMEYFDGPVLGVLAFITDISDTIEEEPSTSP